MNCLDAAPWAIFSIQRGLAMIPAHHSLASSRVRGGQNEIFTEFFPPPGVFQNHGKQNSLL